MVAVVEEGADGKVKQQKTPFVMRGVFSSEETSFLPPSSFRQSHSRRFGKRFFQ